jgi:hypothetical protein
VFDVGGPAKINFAKYHYFKEQYDTTGGHRYSYDSIQVFRKSEDLVHRAKVRFWTQWMVLVMISTASVGLVVVLYPLRDGQ